MDQHPARLQQKAKGRRKWYLSPQAPQTNVPITAIGSVLNTKGSLSTSTISRREILFLISFLNELSPDINTRTVRHSSSSCRIRRYKRNESSREGQGIQKEFFVGTPKPPVIQREQHSTDAIRLCMAFETS